MKKRVLVPPALRPPITSRRGAPFGNRNAFKHGKFTRERRALYADIREHIRRGRELVAGVVDSQLFHPPLEGRDRASGRGSKNRERSERKRMERSDFSGRGRERSERADAYPSPKFAAQISTLPQGEGESWLKRVSGNAE